MGTAILTAAWYIAQQNQPSVAVELEVDQNCRAEEGLGVTERDTIKGLCLGGVRG